LVRDARECMQGLRRNMAMRDETGSWGGDLLVGGGIIATSRDMPPKLQRETSM